MSIADANWGISLSSIARRSYHFGPVFRGSVSSPSSKVVIHVWNRNEKGTRLRPPFRLVTVVMDDGFSLVAVAMFFLDHSGAVTIRLALLDYGAVTIAISIVAFANAHASAYGTNSNSDIVRQRWRRNGRHGGND